GAGRQRELETGAVVWLGFNPDPAAVMLDDLLADCQANAVARIFRARVQPMENREDAGLALWGYAYTIVDDTEAPVPARGFGEDRDHRWLLLAEFDRVSDQVLKYLLQVGTVRRDHWQLLVADNCVAFADGRIQVAQNFFHCRIAVDVLAANPFAA